MIIDLTVKNDRTVTCDVTVIGKENENKATVLNIVLDDQLSDKNIYLEFEKANGEKFITPQLEVTKKICTYEIPNTLLDVKGNLLIEVVARDNENLVFKSNAHKFYVIKSINASEYVEEENKDFISNAQNILDEMEKQTSIFDDTGDGTKFLADDGEYKEIEASGGTSDYNDLTNKPVIYNENYFYLDTQFPSAVGGVVGSYVVIANEYGYLLDNIIVGETYHITFYKDDNFISYDGVGSENNTITYEGLTISNDGVHMIYEAYEVVGEKAYMTIENDKYIIDDNYKELFEDDEESTSLDVQINGTSIVNDGVANIPVASGSLGVSRYYTGYGLYPSSDGLVMTIKANNTDINNRSDNFKPIVSSNLPYAVKSAMTSTTDEEWTTEEKSNARSRIGIDTWEEICDLTVEEEVGSVSVELSKEYKSLRLYLIVPKVTTVNAIRLENSGINIGYAPSNSVSTSTTKYIFMEIEWQNGMGTIGISRQGSNNMTMGAPMMIFNDRDTLISGNATLYFASNFPIGTQVKMWGDK